MHHVHRTDELGSNMKNEQIKRGLRSFVYVFLVVPSSRLCETNRSVITKSQLFVVVNHCTDVMK